MTQDTEMRVQAWLDGELSPAEAQQVARMAETDAETARVVRELRQFKSLLAVGELPRTVPATREFYWSGIARALGQPVEAREESEWAWAVARRWLRWVVPAGIVAAVAVVLLTSKPAPTQNAGLLPAEIDSPVEEAGSITFRSDREQMTVVWVE